MVFLMLIIMITIIIVVIIIIIIIIIITIIMMNKQLRSLKEVGMSSTSISLPSWKILCKLFFSGAVSACVIWRDYCGATCPNDS